MSRVNLVNNFDGEFLKTIKDYKKIHLDQSEGVYYTIMSNELKAGVIGFKRKESGKYFLKIGIHQDFRGQGIFGKALQALIRKHKIKRIYSTVALANKASLGAHQKVGFRLLPKKHLERLKAKGLLLRRNVRMVKTFKQD